jgi:hypothetical protein
MISGPTAATLFLRADRRLARYQHERKRKMNCIGVKRAKPVHISARSFAARQATASANS